MPNYRRLYRPGGCFFFTLVTANRRPIFWDSEARTLLGQRFREVKIVRPFSVIGIVLLPDHLHALWILPEGDTDYPGRWGAIKATFTKEWLASGHDECPVTAARAAECRRGVWQPRYWEHTIRDEQDWEQHLDYIHYNPVKHGYVRRAADWPWSSFHRYVRNGEFDENWGTAESPFQPKFDRVRFEEFE